MVSQRLTVGLFSLLALLVLEGCMTRLVAPPDYARATSAEPPDPSRRPVAVIAETGVSSEPVDICTAPIGIVFVKYQVRLDQFTEKAALGLARELQKARIPVEKEAPRSLKIAVVKAECIPGNNPDVELTVRVTSGEMRAYTFSGKVANLSYENVPLKANAALANALQKAMTNRSLQAYLED